MTNRKFCDGLQRRDLLKVGLTGLFGSGLSLENMLRAENIGAAANDRGLSVIYVFLKGGLSTIDTVDMKPSAPAEFRGDFSPASTNVPGVQICDLLPKMAQQMDKIALLRGFGHKNSDHGPADHYMLTGYFPQAGFNPSLSPNNQRPSLGSIIAKKLGPQNGSARAASPVPTYVCLPQTHNSAGASYLGATCAPLSVDADPAAPDFSVPDLAPPLTLSADRLNSRQALLAKVDKFQRTTELEANSRAKTVDVFRQKAFDLIVSPEAKQAFNLHAENDKLRDEYGRNTLGQSCLMARRLVGAGVRCVTIEHSNWDTHDGNFATLKRDLLPLMDPAISTLFRDLSDRGMLEKTLVVVTGEFGRTPRINKNAGRDHWGPSFTVMLGGGGVKGGRVIGTSDERAERPTDQPHGPEDLFATMTHLLGIDPQQEFLTAEGRPIKIVNDGKIIRSLL
ncbi:DUF1501 domain-containing protein [Anatilimnocola sp. NA78]|uniref:DUF1501 domain-containing protein n=1 Tax=Anatilimnocola sp. NA78 TaxID=3415683 RepID=UPI003CE4DC81